jgi:hypothetical protein
MKQQNDPFILRFAAWHQPGAASSVGFPKAIPTAAIPIVCSTEAVRRSRDVLNNSNASPKAI